MGSEYYDEADFVLSELLVKRRPFWTLRDDGGRSAKKEKSVSCLRF